MLKFNDFQTLITSAETYSALGYSVIPLLGDLDPSRPKVAARPWSVYQHRLATLTEINEWFTSEGGAAALGIVTGYVSHLVVLDFDSPDLYQAFRRQCPNLVETRTIQSAGRALPHLYFHLPSHLRLASQKRQGVDLLSDGRYVVAPPSTINGQSYRVTRGGTPYTLTAHDLHRIQSFLHSLSSIKEEPLAPISMKGLSAERACERADEGVEGEDDLTPSITSSVGTRHVVSVSPLPVLWGGVGGGVIATEPVRKVSSTRVDLHRLYTYWRTQGGRNDALFKTALYARDHGLTELQTRRALAPLHISTHSTACGNQRSEPANVLTGLGRGLPSGNALPESDSPARRQREAYATIHSAFSRPPRVSAVGTSNALSALDSPRPNANAEELGVRAGLPNTLREALLQRKMTFVVRTLEALLQSGFRPGQGFTTDQALKALKGIVGRDSIYNALNTLAPDGQPIFPQRPPSALPQASKEAARDNRTLKTKKCFFVTKKKSGIKKRGVQQRRFKFPTIESLCNRFGVEQSASDPLTRDDLASAHRTRMALHRELIKRRPAEYSRRWLAHRIGVTRRTLDTYNRLIPIHIQATYHETPLSWNNIDTLLSDEILSGAHLETLMGKKYPALKAVAAKLIARGTYVRLMQRKSSFYWYGSDQPPTPQTTPSAVGTRRHALSMPSPSAPLPVLWPSRSEPANVTMEVGGGVIDEQARDEDTPTTHTQSASSIPSAVETRHALSAVSSPRPDANAEGSGMKVLKAIVHNPKFFRRPLPNTQQESLAQSLYARVNACGNPKTRHLSLGNARKLVHTYPTPHIHAALNRLQQRTNLDNPTGFFVTVLRSSAHHVE